MLGRCSSCPELTAILLNSIGIAYMRTGNLSVSETYFTRALDLPETTKKFYSNISLINLLYIWLFKGAYEIIMREASALSLDYPDQYNIDYIRSVAQIALGYPEKAIELLNFLKSKGLPGMFRRRGLEIKGLAMRLKGKTYMAQEYYKESLESFIGVTSTYAPFPCAKALQLSRFAGAELPPKSLIRRCLNLAEKGSWGEQAAAQEIQALLIEDDKTCAEALFAAAQSYQRATQPLEACLSGLHSAYLAWKTSSPVFPDVLKFLAPLLPIHPGFKKDPILGDFATRIEPLLATETSSSESKGIRAYLIGEFRVFVNGERLSLKGWRNNKAILALVYLLLSPQHRIPRDHLFYLLWPRRSYRSEDNRVLFYKAIYLIRRNLRDPRLLTKHRDFYQLEDTWTDLGEIENLARLADATRDPREKEEYLSRAKELANGDLLPEFPYDRHIDEYRQYYYRLRKRLFGE
ncbi:MAG: hypothetical protein ABIM88_08995 [candidate division WOR-3 bacterium]